MRIVKYLYVLLSQVRRYKDPPLMYLLYACVALKLSIDTKAVFSSYIKCMHVVYLIIFYNAR